MVHNKITIRDEGNGKSPHRIHYPRKFDTQSLISAKLRVECTTNQQLPLRYLMKTSTLPLCRAIIRIHNTDDTDKKSDLGLIGIVVWVHVYCAYGRLLETHLFTILPSLSVYLSGHPSMN